nr:MAG TPA: Large Terminase [Caudoviricetes sp.]
MSIWQELIDYSQACILGKEVSGKKHIWACQRFLRDIDRIGTDGFPFVWDEAEAERIVDWFAHLRHTKGVLAKKPIRLVPWQKFVLCQIYGWRHKDTGKRRFRMSFVEVGRKNARIWRLRQKCCRV